MGQQAQGCGIRHFVDAVLAVLLIQLPEALLVVVEDQVDLACPQLLEYL